MCGINGIFSTAGEGSFREIIARMNHVLAHRGPDDEGIFAEEGIALGHRRLSIIDLSAAGHQPMSYARDRYQIVYNGELYNFRELRKELDEVAFQTASDTEVILAAYAKWGTDCLSRFNGMFAFAIWDAQEKTLFIARDRLGIKPLYWTIRGDTLIFSSELRSVLATGLVTKEIDRDALGDFLRYQTVHAPATIISGVYMLLPGHFLFASSKNIATETWWKPQVQETEAKPYGEICKDIRQLLRDAVERRLIADVPFGAFLSGGIDSSAIVGLMSEVAASKVKTFSVVFDDSEFSEAVYARQVAKKFGTEHHEIKLQPEDFLQQLPAALDAMDHPSGDGPNTYVVSGATRKAGITMALSGLGGDELFAGYDIFRRAVELEKEKSWLNNVPRSLRNISGNVLKTLRPGVRAEKISEVLGLEKISFASFYPLNRRLLSPEKIDRLLSYPVSPEVAVSTAVSEIVKAFPGSEKLLSRVSIAEITTYMQNVLLRDTDQMSMAHALEVRVPFLDYTLVEYVLNLPDANKYPSTPKKLLTDSLGDLLPSEIVNRPKMGFTFPWKNWMKNELKDFCSTQLQNLGRRPSFTGTEVDRMWKQFNADDPAVTWSRIWPLVVLSHWLDKNGINA